LLGKVLRIDVRNATAEKPYEIPADNPFVGEEGSRGEIWCYGLRNPWRISFDRKTGELWCGDVGQDRIEEVDLLVKGGNYGWNVMEGTEQFRKDVEVPKDAIPPVAEYPHQDGVSITGGHVYRGSALPEIEALTVALPPPDPTRSVGDAPSPPALPMRNWPSLAMRVPFSMRLEKAALSLGCLGVVSRGLSWVLELPGAHALGASHVDALAANLLAVLPGAVTYSEASPLMQAVLLLAGGGDR
jgi:hypothetical protein